MINSFSLRDPERTLKLIFPCIVNELVVKRDNLEKELPELKKSPLYFIIEK